MPEMPTMHAIAAISPSMPAVRHPQGSPMHGARAVGAIEYAWGATDTRSLAAVPFQGRNLSNTTGVTASFKGSGEPRVDQFVLHFWSNHFR